MTGTPMESAPWLLLIYTVPSQPSRKRATVWRALKKAGAVYLRDGVCVLPTREDTAAAFRTIAATITEFGGQATLIEKVELDPERAAIVQEQARAARAEEYREIMREAEGFLAHVEREREHREFTFAELEEIEADLGKLKRWAEQVRARDHFEATDAQSVGEMLAHCDAAVAAFLEDAYDNDVETGT
jgi:hypothetical protein